MIWRTPSLTNIAEEVPEGETVELLRHVHREEVPTSGDVGADDTRDVRSSL